MTSLVYPTAEFMHRVFSADVLTYQRCGSWGRDYSFLTYFLNQARNRSRRSF